MATLIVAGWIGGSWVVGRGGHAMWVLQVLHGLRSLGHDVVFVEYLDEEPEAEAIPYFAATVEEWWSAERAALLDGRTGRGLAGLRPDEVAEVAGRASALISLGATYHREPWPYLESVRPRVLCEVDPGYTHLWAAEGDPAEIFGEHDVHFTVGLNVGTPRCRLPTLGLRWRPLPPPVLLDWWPGAPAVERDRFTTIAGWRDYGYLEWEGAVIGPKTEEWRRFMDLPARAGEELEIAVDLDHDDPDRGELLRHGWRVEDPAIVATAAGYRDYVAGSAGEFACAKGGYVATRSGWFSDRSACYLAAGRPVILQSTGFEDVLPTGEGLLAVASVEEAADAVRAVRSDYARHSAAARAIAAEHLEACRVLTRLLEEAGIGP